MSSPDERRQARADFRALPPLKRREALRFARSGALHPDPDVRAKALAWADAWSDEFTDARLVFLAFVLVAGVLLAAALFRAVFGAIFVFVEAWLGATLLWNWRAARGMRRARGDRPH